VRPKGVYSAIETQLPVSAFSGLTAWTAPEWDRTQAGAREPL
jgi:hypothetical protein